MKPFDQVFMTVRGHIEDRWVDSFENNFGHQVIDVVTTFRLICMEEMDGFLPWNLMKMPIRSDSAVTLHGWRRK